MEVANNARRGEAVEQSTERLVVRHGRAVQRRQAPLGARRRRLAGDRRRGEIVGTLVVLVRALKLVTTAEPTLHASLGLFQHAAHVARLEVTVLGAARALLVAMAVEDRWNETYA